MLPVFLSYVLSFVYIAIYWNNHHHLLYAASRISGPAMWANQHLLFWLSLVPFVTGWMGENNFAPAPTALYGFVMLMAAVAYWILQRTILATEPPDSVLRRAMRSDIKGNASPLIYAVAIPLAYFSPWLASGLYALVAVIWLVPDTRIEKQLEEHRPHG
jgi:TMEM175 potassium channel family protein